jgi:hypothetical protein
MASASIGERRLVISPTTGGLMPLWRSAMNPGGMVRIAFTWPASSASIARSELRRLRFTSSARRST